MFKMSKINLTRDGEVKEVSTGFSRSTILLGFLVPFYRGDIKWAVIMLVCTVITSGTSVLVFPWIYNKIYIKNLIKDGYLPADSKAKVELERIKIEIPAAVARTGN